MLPLYLKEKRQHHKNLGVYQMIPAYRWQASIPLHVLFLISHYCRIYAAVNWVSIVSGNGLSPIRRQVITWTNAGFLSISVKFESEFYQCHSGKCIWKCRPPEWRPFCPGRDELSDHTDLFVPHWKRATVISLPRCIHYYKHGAKLKSVWVFTPQPSGLEGYCRHGPGGRVAGRAAAKLAEPISL